ncbi:MAG: RNA polymerase sigma factor [Bryobacterales bacterium]|nr:RNA polymerase sigma factor [Bryobacterales bacterium]
MKEMNTARMSWWSPVTPKRNPALEAAEPAEGRVREAEQLRLLADGSPDAFAAIYREHGQRIFRIACRHTASRELAEEVAQETFLFFLRHPGKFDPARGELGAYLAGIARQLARRALEQAGRTLSMDSEEDHFPDESVTNALHELIEHQQWQLLHEAVVSLPEPYREIVVMHHLEELSYEEIAGELACPLGTVRSRLSRGREMLARKLAGRQPERSARAEQWNPRPEKGGIRHGMEE